MPKYAVLRLRHGYGGYTQEEETMDRIIRINDCKVCPSCDHRGGFGVIAYVPVCLKAGIELPYTTVVSGTRLAAQRNEGIPDWCPLETSDATASKPSPCKTE